MHPWLRVRPFYRWLAAVALVVGSTLAALVSQPVWPAHPRAPLAHANADALARHVRFLAVDCVPRDFAAYANLDAAADYVAARFREVDGRVHEQFYVPAVEGSVRVHDSAIARSQVARPVRNVIAEFGPTSGPTYVVGAHYDAHGGHPGADDNASGTAVLLELARLLSLRPPPRRTMLVAWTLEEPPWFAGPDMGSRVHAAALRRSGDDVRGVIGLEMLGVYDDVPGSQRYPVPGMGLVYPSRGDFIAVVGRFDDIAFTRELKTALSGTRGVPVWSFDAPASLAWIGLSDHASYWHEGFGAVMVTDTAFFRNAHYHRATDTPARLDVHRMARVTEMLHGALVRMR